MPEVRQNQKRTAIIYFGPEQDDYLNLVQTEDRREFLAYIQPPRAGQSLAHFFGAKFKRIPGMEALNLCTVGTLNSLVPEPSS